MIPFDVLLKQEMCGFVDLKWIGTVEVTITVDAGSGGLLVHAVDHARYTGDKPHLMFSSLCGSIGEARGKFREMVGRLAA